MVIRLRFNKRSLLYPLLSMSLNDGGVDGCSLYNTRLYLDFSEVDFAAHSKDDMSSEQRSA